MSKHYGSLQIEQDNNMSQIKNERAGLDDVDLDDVERRIFHSRLADGDATDCISSDLIFSSSSRMIKMVKVFAVSCFLVALLQYTSSWITPKHLFQKAAAIASISTVIATNPLLAEAIDFSGSYEDPMHPNCLREILQVVSSGKADVSGTDGTPGCPPDGSGKAWNLVGTIDGDSILVDFSPKGGPNDLKGVWEATPIPGIRWPDGNLWNVKTTIQ